MITCWAKNATFVSTNISSTKYAFQGKIKGFIIQLSKAITYFSVPRQNMSIFFPNNNLLLENLTHKSSDSVRKTKHFPVVLNGPDSSQWQKT